ncbi:hypothetical protein H0H92_013620 [Tricholoma furcatifolium]|nr:hypothetical protein H0H92_013620 [Tricholoma furcatifolium]
MSKGTLPRGDFVAYPTWEAHLNPDIYPRPYEFDPERFGPERKEDKTHPFAFLAWGAGRHPCAGIQLAKLQMRIFVAFFLLTFEYEFVDGAGKPLVQVPRPDFNDIQLARPIGGPYFMKFKRAMV